MPTPGELKAKYKLPKNYNGAKAVNGAIRRAIPGGSELLDVMTRLHEIQHSRPTPDRLIQGLLDKLRDGRDKMAISLLDEKQIEDWSAVELED